MSRPQNRENLQSLADQVVWAVQNYVGGGVENIPQFTGDIYYVSTSGSDASDGNFGAAEIGSMAIKVEDPGKALAILSSALPAVEKGVDPKKRGALITAELGENTYIRWMCDGNNDTSGELHHHVEYVPLTEDGWLEPV